MRVTSTDSDAYAFTQYLLRIGSGTEKTYEKEIGPYMVLIPEEFRSKAKNPQHFFQEIFHELESMKKRHFDNWNTFITSMDWKRWIMSRVIICPTNIDTEDINQILIKALPGQLHVFRSFDKVLNEKEGFNYPLEYLNSIHLGSIPPHILELKEGCPIILLRNMDPQVCSAGLP